MGYTFGNFGESVLDANLGIGDSSLTIPAADADRFPAAASVANPTPAVLYDRDQPQNPEIVHITVVRTTGVYTITRAEENTVAQAWQAGTILAAVATAAALQDINPEAGLYALEDLSNVDNDSVVNALMANNSVDTAEIVDDAITQDKIAPLAVNTPEIAAEAIGAAKVLNGAITNPKMATDSIDTANIVDGSVTNEKLALDGARIPPGMIMAWPTASLPTGWLECSGTAVSRTTYADLFAEIGTDFGVGDGSTTFNLPNLVDRYLQGFNSAENLPGEGGIGAPAVRNNVAHVHNVNGVTGSGGAMAGFLYVTDGSAASDHDTDSEGSALSFVAGPTRMIVIWMIKT